MKIIFTVHKENRETGVAVQCYSTVIHTNWNITQIDNHLELYNFFHSNLILGQTLAFWDLYCFFDDVQPLINRIESIPKSKTVNHHPATPSFLRIGEFNPGTADYPQHPDTTKTFIYSLSRYECGANSYEAIILWMASHPFEMVFIGGMLYDLAKAILVKVLKILGIRRRKHITSKRPIILRVKKLYKHFSQITHIKEEDCQIVKLNRLRTGLFSTYIRTMENECYKVKCYSDGRIVSLDPVDFTEAYNQ